MSTKRFQQSQMYTIQSCLRIYRTKAFLNCRLLFDEEPRLVNRYVQVIKCFQTILLYHKSKSIKYVDDASKSMVKQRRYCKVSEHKQADVHDHSNTNQTYVALR